MWKVVKLTLVFRCWFTQSHDSENSDIRIFQLQHVLQMVYLYRIRDESAIFSTLGNNSVEKFSRATFIQQRCVKNWRYTNASRYPFKCHSFGECFTLLHIRWDDWKICAEYVFFGVYSIEKFFIPAFLFSCHNARQYFLNNITGIWET